MHGSDGQALLCVDEITNGAHDLHLVFEVKMVARLVQQHDGRVLHQQRGESQPPCFTA